MDKLEDESFDEVVQYFSNLALTSLLESGGKGLKSNMHHAMDFAIRWSKHQEDKAMKSKSVLKNGMCFKK